jgi:prolyl-tRNA editing enzyme YbaK/EbsC (Cys-tRNA(Pro) deacylase)
MSDTAEFSEAYGIELDDCANTIVIQYRKGGVERYAAVVSLGSRRLDINGAVKSGLSAQRLSFAKREIAIALTGMEYGAITAFGVPEDWPILIDEVVLSRRQIVVGAGVRTAKLLISPGLLTRLPNAQVGVFSTIAK